MAINLIRCEIIPKSLSQSRTKKHFTKSTYRRITRPRLKANYSYSLSHKSAPQSLQSFVCNRFSISQTRYKYSGLTCHVLFSLAMKILWSGIHFYKLVLHNVRVLSFFLLVFFFSHSYFNIFKRVNNMKFFTKISLVSLSNKRKIILL